VQVTPKKIESRQGRLKLFAEIEKDFPFLAGLVLGIMFLLLLIQGVTGGYGHQKNAQTKCL